MSYGRGPPEIDGMTSLKVDNLTYRTTPEDLRRAFDKYGDVGDVYIPRDRFTRESRGFAFVRFYDKRDAEDALDSMDGAIMDGRELRVQMARYGRPTEPYRRGPPRRSSGYRSRYRLMKRCLFRKHCLHLFSSFLTVFGFLIFRSRSRSRSRSRRRSRSRSRRRSRRSRSYSRSRSRSRSNSKSPSRSRSRSRSKSASRSPDRNDDGQREED